MGSFKPGITKKNDRNTENKGVGEFKKIGMEKFRVLDPPATDKNTDADTKLYRGTINNKIKLFSSGERRTQVNKEGNHDQLQNSLNKRRQIVTQDWTDRDKF